MRQINFGLIFSFGLITVFFTLANTSPTTVHVLPGCRVHPAFGGSAAAGSGVGSRVGLVLRGLDRDAQQR